MTRSTWARSRPVEQGFRTSAQWYDGVTARRHEGEAEWDGSGQLLLHSSDGQSTAVALEDLRYFEKRRDSLVYARDSVADFRLVLPADLPPALDRALPTRGEYGAWIDRMGLGKAIIGFGAISAVAVALFMTAPEWLGPRVPVSWERKMGDAMIGNFGGRLCHTPAADAALAKMQDRIDPAAGDIRVGLANIDMVNAVALPGGQVLMFDGIIQQAESPEELAGVLGHEIGHVRERHVMTALLRQFGLSILLAGANSGLGDTAFGIAAMGYSRDAELEADAYARKQMAKGRVSPLGAAGFFERMAKESGEGESPALIGWIATHPSSRDRAKAYRTSATEGAAYPPVLTKQEFAALKSACKDDPDVEDFDFF
ncbi:M48 family metallopeptidase [Qipengyuania marisflavi]|uniref:M48 family metallopeptidase n=1 Tax=Qipengyuania marisflavi TaxID=2486356 RepID=UPI001CA3A599|nr:M48 family metallopeptidase [Qipengyuania marisflavi]